MDLWPVKAFPKLCLLKHEIALFTEHTKSFYGKNFALTDQFNQVIPVIFNDIS